MNESPTKYGESNPEPSTECAPTKSKSTLTPTCETTEASDATELAAPLPFGEALHQLNGWILKGNCEHDLREAIAQFFPHLSAEELLRKAAEHFQLAGESDPQAVRGFCIEAYRDLYRRCIEIGDFTTALKALARLETTSRK